MKRFINSTVTFPVTVTVAVIFFFLLLLSPVVTSLGSGSTYAVVYGSDTVCALISGQSTQRILCYDTRRRTDVTLSPGVSFSSIAAGDNLLCGIRSGGYSLLCWDNIGSYTLDPKRIYLNDTVLLQSLSVGDKQICATVNGTDSLKCWRDSDQSKPPTNGRFRSISSGVGFSCGVSIPNNRILCWGSDSTKSGQIQTGFGNTTMMTISAGESHACGLNTTGDLICIGNNESGQLNVVTSDQRNRYSSLSLGSNFTCATRSSNNSVVCWGGGAERFNNVTDSISFESISSGPGLICGLVSSNLSVMCWNPSNFSRIFLPFPEVLPGPCVAPPSLCSCGIYPQSDKLCSGSGSICRSCPVQFPASPPSQFPLPPPPSSSRSASSPPSKALTRGLLAFAIVGSVGAFAGICSVVYCLWTGACLGKKKVHNSVQPTITRGGSSSRSNSSNSRSLTIRRQGSRMLSMRRQRSGTSSMKHPDKAEEFSFSELASATGNFSLENKIGSGSFGVVYRGKLSDGREVAIKRGEVNAKMKKLQEKETAFDSEIAFLSRLHHKHLVRLVGYCEEKDERLLVYDYMKNGALYDHLHDKNNVEKHSSLINSWKMRIKIALDAARGIEYLHNYAVPPIIHRDIKSSNILLDSNWVARVSDFGLSLMGPELGKDHNHHHHHQLPMKAAGTVGYIDPEYYSLNVLTDKSDVYGLGVVLLELLTGKRAIFKNGGDLEEGSVEAAPVHLVDYSVPAITVDELGRILDPRVGSPGLGEGDAVELVAYTAMHCVNAEGRNRPTMTDIVGNLERALDLCGDSHGSISSGICSIVSD